MSFTDYLFLPAFLVLSLVYFHVPLRLRWTVLLAASLLFYASWGGWGFVYLLGAVLIAWLTGLWLARQQEKEKSSRKVLRIGLFIGVGLLVLVLVLVKLRAADKYGFAALVLPEGLYKAVLWRAQNLWFAEGTALYNAAAWLASHVQAPASDSVTMALGISYFTLSLIGYIADVYWKKETAERNPLHLLLFAAYFPKIIEGPITKYRTFRAQVFSTEVQGHSEQQDEKLQNPHFDYPRFCRGLQRVLWGFIKKLVIADRLSIFTGTVFWKL